MHTLQELEAKLARFIGCKYFLVTGAGRAALKIALLSSGIEGGKVIIPNLICPIVPETIISSGFTPLPVDVKADLSMNLEPVDRAVGQECKAIMPVYLAHR